MIEPTDPVERFIGPLALPNHPLCCLVEGGGLLEGVIPTTGVGEGGWPPSAPGGGPPPPFGGGGLLRIGRSGGGRLGEIGGVPDCPCGLPDCPCGLPGCLGASSRVTDSLTGGAGGLAGGATLTGRSEGGAGLLLGPP